ncbi:p-loop containing nucleoside triphosphate hydrolase protein [Mycena chlorophos]|uniref:ATP synthase subunit 5, mitochondrial n=1 Tax=Mycena chlorophos TaxID=658473 RepID=A0A8H6SEZ3_MYCCL|nr:p-loop containing nucleoside triphosphate hydrolase protein [Mycena chlorophos]
MLARRIAAAPGLGQRAASTIALKYSNALYQAALNKSPQTLSKVHAELATVSSTIAQDASLNSFITNPTLSANERKAGLGVLYSRLDAALPKKEPVSDITKNLLGVLSENGRLAETPGVIEGFNELVEKYRGELTVVVTSAATLPRDVLSRLETALKQSQAGQTAKLLKVTNKVNPSILGGIVVDFGDKTIDLSVQSRVTKFNSALQRMLLHCVSCILLWFNRGRLEVVEDEEECSRNSDHVTTRVFLRWLLSGKLVCGFKVGIHGRSPICGKSVVDEINSHIDRCLSAPTAQKRPQPQNVAPIFNMKRKWADEPSSSPPVDSSTRVHTPSSSPVVLSNTEPPPKRARNKAAHAPWAEKLRPSSFAEPSFGDRAGEFHDVQPLRHLFVDRCGKTTIARLVATTSNAVFKELSATVAGVNDIKTIVDGAKSTLALTGRRTILFLDEIHRFNKGQQLIGATTENPSFKLNGALLSRCRVFALQRLVEADIETIITSALAQLSSDDSGQHTSLRSSLSDKCMSSIVALSAGDARTALSLLELSVNAPQDMDDSALQALMRNSVVTNYDRSEDHYDMISALHKSIRGSQPNAALYWLARMLAGGEDPLYLARRLIVVSSEDVGLADNQALPLAIATLQACQHIGMPECKINLAHLVAYLSEAPKSTRAYEAYSRAEQAVAVDPTIPVPLSMRNAPTSLMKELGYGKTYRYNPEYAHPVTNVYLPSALENAEFLRQPGDKRDKTWDEDALKEWEARNGVPWEGR